MQRLGVSDFRVGDDDDWLERLDRNEPTSMYLGLQLSFEQIALVWPHLHFRSCTVIDKTDGRHVHMCQVTHILQPA